MRFFTKEVRIALVAIVGVVILFFGMQFLKGLTLFSTANNYYVVFSDVSGLSNSSPIYANGVKVGVVEAIDYDYSHPDRIIAELGLDPELQLPKGTAAEIVSDLLGNVKLELRFGNMADGMLAEGDTISGAQQVGALGKASAMIPQIEQMLPKLDSILASVNALLADPAIRQSVHNVDQITANLTAATNQLTALSTSLNSQLPPMLQKADGVLTNTQTLTQNLSDVDIAATMASVNNTLNNVEQMTARLNSKEGTLGLLMRDPSFYQNLNATMAHADSLMIDFKAHPKRYVHFSVFGKKDR